MGYYAGLPCTELLCQGVPSCNHPVAQFLGNVILAHRQVSGKTSGLNWLKLINNVLFGMATDWLDF